MALPPLSPAAPAADMMPPAEGAEMEGGPTVFATILQAADGKFILIDGDEPEGPEGGDAMADGAAVDGPGLLKQLMAKIEGGTDGAEASFGAGFRGEPDPAAKGASSMPMA